MILLGAKNVGPHCAQRFRIGDRAGMRGRMEDTVKGEGAVHGVITRVVQRCPQSKRAGGHNKRLDVLEFATLALEDKGPPDLSGEEIMGAGLTLPVTQILAQPSLCRL
jgi:hypothetical protein